MGDTTATFEWAFRWLRPQPAAVAAADPGARRLPDGNHRRRFRAWPPCWIETGARRRPQEDLAWFCIRLAVRRAQGTGCRRLGGIPDFLKAYERRRWRTRRPRRVPLVARAGHLRWGVICRYQAERHLSGQTPSVELATIGRRVCETEWDLLNLLSDFGAETVAERRNCPKSRRRPPEPARRPPRSNWSPPSPDFLDGDVRANTEGRVNFHARVAANALRMVQRELRSPPAQPTSPPLNELRLVREELAGAIRRGEFDDHADDLVVGLRVLVGHRLAAAHPGYESEE